MRTTSLGLRHRINTSRQSGRLRLGGALVAFMLAGAACTGPGSSPPAGSGDGEPLRVVATTTVLADLVARTGGERVSVTSLVPKGAEVHTFDPSPDDVRRVADAQLIVMNGLGLDEWVADLIENAGADVAVVELAEDLDGVEYLGAEPDRHENGDGDEGKSHAPERSHAPEESHAAGESHAAEESHAADESHSADSDGHAHEGANPHLWLNVAHAQRYVERIGVALSNADPEHAAAYVEGARSYGQRLAGLDEWVRAQVATIPEPDRRVISFHEAFPYFAAAYGLEIVGTVIESPGQEPSAGEVAALIDTIRAEGARAIFAETQFPDDLVATISAETGVTIVSDLYNDSLGDPPVDTYEGLIRWDVDRIVAALR